MSSFDPSMEPMLEMFIYETTTLLEQLDEILLDSEKSAGMSEENINEIFRIMHTIKGSSAMMDIQSVSRLAHAVEDVFFIIRETPEKLNLVSRAIYDLVFQASDFFKTEVESVQGDTYIAQNPDSIIAQLKEQAAIMRGEQSAVFAAAPVAAPQAVPEVSVADDGLERIRVFFEDGCQMENIRAFMLMTQLHDLCDVLESEPPHPESDSSLSAEIIRNGFIVKCRPATGMADVLKVVESSLNIKTYEILTKSAPVAQTVAATSSSAPSAVSVQAAAADEPAQAALGQTRIPSKQSLISVNQTKLDQLMDLVGEIVTTESMLVSSPDLKGLVLDNFNKSTRELRKLTDTLQDIVMSMRMVPLSASFQKMNRLVRDMSIKLGKKVDLVSNGGDTEVDKTINDSLTDPFMHMVRNAMDHAMEMPAERVAAGKPETGRITMAAQNVGGEIVITIADDGCGLDTARILKKARENGLLTKPENEYSDQEIYHMIMLPGFSTNEAVTEYSGRGVGMDVVRQNIEKVSGTISVASSKGVGTVFTIKIPLTLAIVDGMEVTVGGEVFTLPITSIKQCFKLADPAQVILDAEGAEMMVIRGKVCPVLRLHKLFNISTQVTDLSEGILIQVETDDKTACIFADELLGEQQVVVKPFPVYLNRFNIKATGLSGCSILGDGSISLILDASSLLKSFER